MRSASADRANESKGRTMANEPNYGKVLQVIGPTVDLKFPSDRLPDSLPIQGSGEIIDDVVRDGPVVLVTGIDGTHVLESLLQEHLSHRLVLELDQIDVLGSHLIGQLVLLHKWISEHDGVLRLCGLSTRNRRVLKRCHLEGRFPPYGNRMDAVMCRGSARARRRPK